MKILFVLIVGVVLLAGCGRADNTAQTTNTSLRSAHYISQNPTGQQQ